MTAVKRDELVLHQRYRIQWRPLVGRDTVSDVTGEIRRTGPVTVVLHTDRGFDIDVPVRFITHVEEAS